MRIILHLGAQRTATTNLQHYMRSHRSDLAKHRIGFWGPRRTRNSGMFEGLFNRSHIPVAPDTLDHARRALDAALKQSRARGVKTLIISDENMLGSAKHNLNAGALYPEAWRRLARFATAFDGRVDTVLLGVRSLEAYWPSTIAYAVKRGASLPSQAKLDDIVEARRSWRDVAQDVADCFIGANIEVHRFESFASRPDLRLGQVTGKQLAVPHTPDIKLNEAPDLDELRAILARRCDTQQALPRGSGRYQPFGAEARIELKEQFADDMFWMKGGAGGVARLIDEITPEEAGQSLPLALGRGHHYDQARGLDRAS